MSPYYWNVSSNDPGLFFATEEDAARGTKGVPADAPCIAAAVDIAMPTAGDGIGELDAAKASGGGGA